MPDGLTPGEPLTLAEASEVRYLDPATLCFFRHGATLRLTEGEECSHLFVSVLRLFPLSEPGRYLSLRDGANKEIGVVVEPDAVEVDGRRLLLDALERRYLVPVIRRVKSVRERFGTLDWEVETDRGARAFTTRNLRENTVTPSPGRYLLSDVDGNRYDVPDLDALDGASQAILSRYL